MSKIEVNAIEPQCGTTLTLGASGDTVALASGASQTGFGRTGTVDWITTPKTATFSAVSGEGYFCNTSGGAFTVNLPAGVAGAIVSLADYAATWQTNNLTVSPNGTDKIGSINENAILRTEGQSVTFVFVDSTQGWINTMDSTSNVRGVLPFIAATGGTPTTSPCGDFKIHTFTGPGTFTVTSAGTPDGSTTLEYLVVAAGGGGGGDNTGTAGGGGGAGGFRFASPTLAPATYPAKPLAAPAGITAAVQGYPVTVSAGGGAAGPATSPGGDGSNSVFGPITSTGGGGGGSAGGPNGPSNAGQNGGSGGGAQYYNALANGSGNTPSVSPSQGNDGGDSVNPSSLYGSGGGGGALAVGVTTTASSFGGNGGVGGGFPEVFSGSNGQSSGGSRYFSGGGGGGVWSNIPGPAFPTSGVGSGGLGGGGNAGALSAPNTPSPGNNATANTGGGGGGGTGGTGGTTTGGAGGSGIVIIRYKFQ